MNTRLIRVLLILALGSSLILAGAVPASAQGKPLRIAVSMVDLALPFFVNMAKQIEEEAAALGDIEIVVFDGENQTGKQAEDLQEVVAGKFDGLLISPINAVALVPAVQEVVDANIPVITIDRGVQGVQTLAHVSADNVVGGEAQGQLIIDLFPDGARIFNLQGTPGATPAIARNQGLHRALRGKAEYEFVFEKTANFRRDDARTVIAEALEEAETLPDVISCANDDMALGVVDVLKEKGLIGQIVVIGYDALPEALAAIRDGEMTGTVEQFPGGQSRRALQLMVDYLRNDTLPEAHDTFLEPLMITLDNLDQAERIGEAEPPPTMEPTPEATKSD